MPNALHVSASASFLKSPAIPVYVPTMSAGIARTSIGSRTVSFDLPAVVTVNFVENVPAFVGTPTTEYAFVDLSCTSLSPSGSFSALMVVWE